MCRARTKPSASSRSRRTSCGHAVSSKTRGSGDRQTLALISEVPPRPHAISTLTSLPTRTSNSAVADPSRPCGPFICVSAVALAMPSGKSPGRNSRPALQHRHLLPAARQARGGNAAPIARSHHDHVVVRLQLRSGHRQPRLHTPYFPVLRRAASPRPSLVLKRSPMCPAVWYSAASNRQRVSRSDPRSGSAAAAASARWPARR